MMNIILLFILKYFIINNVNIKYIDINNINKISNFKR